MLFFGGGGGGGVHLGYATQTLWHTNRFAHTFDL